jgi:ketosteroid isomerase-like protein
MNTDEFLIEKTIKLYEFNTGWGDSDDWSNQDFIILSEKIQERTGAPLSHVTLKRVWGKVRYDSLPNTHTLDTLVRFLGYESWRDFRSQNGNTRASGLTAKQINGNCDDHITVDYKPAPKKQTWILKSILFSAIPVALIVLILSIVSMHGLSIKSNGWLPIVARSPVPVTFESAVNVKPVIGPTTANALAADQELARVLQNNDTVGIERLLDKDWAVITSNGGVAEGPSIFTGGIKSGYRVLKIMSLSEPRVRLHGNIALVTTKVELAGIFGGKAFDIQERRTDVWCWKDGGWKCILTQEAVIPKAR